MRVCCLDLEGVMLPEIWIAVARTFRVEELRLTTRDIPDYDKLMKYRLKILRKEGIRLKDIQIVIGRMRPLPGAKIFIKKLQRSFPVIVLSDTFYDFAGPLMRQLDNPTLFCHDLILDRKGFISGYQLRQKDSKRQAIKALKACGFQTIAAGDSYNDLSMLQAADAGVLFRPPASIRKKYGKRFPVAATHARLLKLLHKPL